MILRRNSTLNFHVSTTVIVTPPIIVAKAFLIWHSIYSAQSVSIEYLMCLNYIQLSKYPIKLTYWQSLLISPPFLNRFQIISPEKLFLSLSPQTDKFSRLIIQNWFRIGGLIEQGLNYLWVGYPLFHVLCMINRGTHIHCLGLDLSSSGTPLPSPAWGGGRTCQRTSA